MENDSKSSTLSSASIAGGVGVIYLPTPIFIAFNLPQPSLSPTAAIAYLYNLVVVVGEETIVLKRQSPHIHTLTTHLIRKEVQLVFLAPEFIASTGQVVAGPEQSRGNDR
jgi:hypothetical protein